MARQRKEIALEELIGKGETVFPGEHEGIGIRRLDPFHLLLEGPRAVIYTWVQRDLPPEDIILRRKVSSVVPLDILT